ncbi:MAG: BatD family protein [Gammaproteobacteria bacterium]|nr:BatD family protein [Gammaproteobacteria bacterium]
MRAKIFLCGLSFILWFNTLMAAPAASVDRTQLSTEDTLILQIVDEDVGADNPDLTPLSTDFNVRSTVLSTEVQSINGKMSQKKTWSIGLTPKHSGTLTIPSLTLGTDKTDPIIIEVSNPQSSGATTASSKKDDATANNQPPIFMQTTLAPKSVYEGQAGLYTVKIFYNTSVREPSLTLPDIDNAKLIHVGKDTNQRTTMNGQNYQVLEQHYAIIAQRDGILDVQSPTLQGFRLDLTRNDSFNNPWQPFRISAPSLSLKVNTVPGMTKSSWWLPSTKVLLTDSWTQNPPHFQSGVPITRTLTLRAQNVIAEQLPTLAPSQNDGFQLYPDKPLLNTDSNGFQLQATRTEKIAYLPNANGQLTIPAINIDWWDTDSNSPKKVTIPAYTVTVASSTNTVIDHDAASAPAVLSLGENVVQTPPQNNTANWAKNPFLILSLLLGVAWVTTVVLWWRSTKPKTRSKTHNLHNSEEIKTLRQLRTDLRIACQQNNALDAKAALLAIGKELWPYETVLSVGDLSEKFQQQKTKQLLQELESVLYKESALWHGAQLWTLLDEEFRTQAKTSTDPEDILPHLYLEEKK